MNFPLLQRPILLLILAGLTVALMGVLIYLPGLPGDFVFDDLGTIANNPMLQHMPPGLDGLLQALLSAPVGGLLRPISTLTFIADAKLFGLSPESFKLTNIAIHLSAGTMLWLVARELLRAYAPVSGGRLDERGVAWLSLAATALWLLHPLNLTSVLYTVQRDNSLAAVFTAAATLSYLVGRRRERATGDGSWLVLMCTPTLITLGLLCKENAALTPLFLLITEFTLLHFQGQGGGPSPRTRWFFILFLALPSLAVGLYFVMRPAYFLAAYQIRDFDMYERLLSESRILVDYLRWIFVPDLGQLGLFHDDIAVSRGLLQPWTTLPCVAAVLMLIAAAFLCRRRYPLLSFGILWFFAGHLLESTILPLELVFEHRNYLPCFGLLFGCVGTLYPMASDAAQRRLVKVGLCSCIMLMGIITAQRADQWRSELAFARNEALHHPGSARANSELQWAYAAYILASHDLTLLPQATAAAERSKALDPGSINQDVGLAYLYVNLQEYQQAHQHLQQAAQRVSEARASATLQLSLQTLLQITGPALLRPDIDAVFRNALSNPDLTREECYHGELWNTYALFLADIQEIPRALESLHKAVSLCPLGTMIRVNYAGFLLNLGDAHDAAAQIAILDAQHDIRHLPELRSLHEKYAALSAAGGR